MIKLIFAILHSFTPADYISVDFEGDCKADHIFEVSEMISEASYVGLYAVSDRRNNVTKFEIDAHEYELVLINDISGNSPDKVIMHGTKSHVPVPYYFFSLKEIHQDMIAADSTLLGQAVKYGDSSGECVFVPEFVTGYSYLIFGGVQSAAFAEPVLSTTYDPLYHYVHKYFEDRSF